MFASHEELNFIDMSTEQQLLREKFAAEGKMREFQKIRRVLVSAPLKVHVVGFMKIQTKKSLEASLAFRRVSWIAITCIKGLSRQDKVEDRKARNIFRSRSSPSYSSRRYTMETTSFMSR